MTVWSEAVPGDIIDRVIKWLESSVARQVRGGGGT